MFNAFQYTTNTAYSIGIGIGIGIEAEIVIRFLFSEVLNIFLSLSVPDRFQVLAFQTSQLYKS